MDVLTLAQASSDSQLATGITDAGKAIALGARQPEMKDDLQSIRWLGFALTEAVAFYTFIFGLIAFFL